ncbi:YdcF family protein [Phyllobacterium phragmitis]|uniref:YdcF family protein n=1 Tax=Phyllobacterium phragmitis TaxID=2670329 RepID=A0A2S9IP16_9HYPH|nr:YdcF family protein [Phyllobacterium phragmitis]PRD42268.1 YdcF family protein [Phyllobacterium phragmitis]
MFFALSKILWLFTQPITLLLAGILASMLAMAFARRRMALVFSAITVVLFVLVSFTTLGNVLLLPLEERFPANPALPERIDGIVVLGGFMEGEVNASRGGHEINGAGDRIIETMRLARLYPEARIVVSGGEGTFFTDSVPDAISARQLFRNFGLTGERLSFEAESRNTYENAVYSRELVKPREGETWLLITSAFHMPRAMGCFRQADFSVIAWPVDYLTRRDRGFSIDLQDPVGGLARTTIAVREWLGLQSYWFTGKIGNAFPAPQNT